MALSPGVSTIVRSAAVGVWLTALCTGPRAGQAPPPGPAYPAGQVVERVACASDPNQSYALYLPTSYDPSRRWPVVFIMDPRGRALLALDLFVPAAERLGYVLASSYNTASDGPAIVNTRAVAAALPDLQARLSLNSRRVYFAGFSGTARASWEFAAHLTGRVAGLVGVGAGLPGGDSPPASVRIPFFGAAGDIDFNWDEMWRLDRKLEGAGLPHRFESFEGGHAWAPGPICSEALEWMELQAIKATLRERDDALIEDWLRTRESAARRLEASGRLHDAWRAWLAIAADFDSLRDVTGARSRAAQLAREKPVRKVEAQLASIDRRRRAYDLRLGTFFGGYGAPNAAPPHAESVAHLQIRALQRQARLKEDPLAARAAQRMLEQLFVHAAFYEPRQYLDLGDAARALGLLRLAGEIRPDSPGVCFRQAQALARLGRPAEALTALECAAASGAFTAEEIADEELLAPLRGEARYRAVIERLSKPQPPPG